MLLYNYSSIFLLLKFPVRRNTNVRRYGFRYSVFHAKTQENYD